MSGSTIFPRIGNEPISSHVISNLVCLQEVRNHGANSLLHFLLISCSSFRHHSQISMCTKLVSGLIHVGRLYTALLSEQGRGGVRCGGAEERGELLLRLQEPGMLIGKIVLIRPSSLQMLGELMSVGPHRREGSSQPDIVSKQVTQYKVSCVKQLRHKWIKRFSCLLCVCICLKRSRRIYHDTHSLLTNAQSGKYMVNKFT